jgi:hypothetical protein
MTEKERLEKYISEGFNTHMVIRKISDDEKKTRLPEFYWDKEVFALPLWRQDNKKLIFYFSEKETKEYAQSLIEKGKEIIGYHLVVYISVLSDEAVQGRKVYLESVIDSLKEVKRWNAKPSQYPNVFEIHFDINSSEEQKVEQAIKEVEQTLLLLTLINKKGFHIASYSPGERYRHQPFAVNFGLIETRLEGISVKEIERYRGLLKNDNFIEALNALRLIYSQINHISKITVCWVTIEDLFGHSKPTHILEQNEINKVIDAINGTDLGDVKKALLANRIKDSSLFSIKNRNERIAENISNLLGQDLDNVKEQLKGMSKARGKLVHSISMNDIDIQPYLQFTEKILLKYLDNSNP